MSLLLPLNISNSGCKCHAVRQESENEKQQVSTNHSDQKQILKSTMNYFKKHKLS